MNILQIIPNYLSKRCNNTNNYIQDSNYKLNPNITYPNLKPLIQDTVSFGSKSKIIQETVNELSRNKNFFWNPNNKKRMAEINNLCESFQEPLKKFHWDLRQVVRSITCTEANPNDIIMPGSRGLRARVKEPKKVARKANKRNITTIEGIEKMGDVGGARIILRSSSTTDTGILFYCLKDMIKKGYKVVEVENYRPNSKDSYVAQKTLDTFEEFCHTHGQYPSIRSRALPNNYSAIHVSFELPDGKIIELQIMGRDVENYKEVEDLFYKYRCNEDLSDELKPIQRMFERIMPKLDDFQKETLERYHKDSYKHARQLPARSARAKFVPEKDFLPFPYSLPQELNPVNLYYQMAKLKTNAKPQ